MQIYLVGGAVRDGLLNLPVADRDWVVVGANAAQMLALGYQQVGKDFPVFLHPQTREEYALARTERKQGQGYHGFEVIANEQVRLEDDLLRRDLTINAMAQAEHGEIIDPYAGQQDLAQRRLRHVSPAFEEDPLRVLRVARFRAQLANQQFSIAPETLELMKKMTQSGELNHLVPERVWQEIAKALLTPKPSLFFTSLHEVGALTVLMPEIARLFDVPQSSQHHPEGDAGIHTMRVLDTAAAMEQDLAVRFAALVHDLGKGVTPEALWPDHPQHENAGVPIVNRLCEHYRVPKAIQRLAARATAWHGLIHKGPSLPVTEQFDLLKGCDAFRQADAFYATLKVCIADCRGRLGYETAAYPQEAFWTGALSAVQAINPAELVAAGIKGEAMAQAIDQRRLAALAAYNQTWLDEHEV